MANEDHVKRAGYAIAVWNRWRDENPEIAPDLSGAKLSNGLYLKGKLHNANLERTDYRGSNLKEADLHESNLQKADLSKSDLRKANLSNTKLLGAELSKSNLLEANLSGADLSGADLEKAQLGKANITRAKFKGANLRNTDLSMVIGVTQEQIDQADGDNTTHLPKGIKQPERWRTSSNRKDA